MFFSYRSEIPLVLILRNQRPINQRRHHMKHHIDAVHWRDAAFQADGPSRTRVSRTSCASWPLDCDGQEDSDNLSFHPGRCQRTRAGDTQSGPRYAAVAARAGSEGREAPEGQLQVGVDIPTREEIKALVDALSGHWRPLLMTTVFTGMRSSEIRGLRWQDVDFHQGNPRSPTRRRVRGDRAAEVGGGNQYHPRAANRDQHPAGVVR